MRINVCRHSLRGACEQRCRAGRRGNAQRCPVSERLGTFQHLCRQRCQSTKQTQTRRDVDQYTLRRGNRHIGTKTQQRQRQRFKRERLGGFVAIVKPRLWQERENTAATHARLHTRRLRRLARLPDT